MRDLSNKQDTNGTTQTQNWLILDDGHMFENRHT